MSEPLTERLTIYMTQKQKRALQVTAKRTGTTLSALIRRGAGLRT